MALPGELLWNRQPVVDPAAADVVRYGPDVATEAELRLLGQVGDKRVLELGCGSGVNSVALGAQGARPIGLDFSPAHLTSARRLADRAGIRVEFHEGDLADLAFCRADTVDAVFSVYALNLVEDVNRVFRQVHRVLKGGCPLVFSVPHPTYDMFAGGDQGPLIVSRSYFDGGRIELGTDQPPFFGYHHRVADLFVGLTRANFRVDTILEPEPQFDAWVPQTLIVRARKE